MARDVAQQRLGIRPYGPLHPDVGVTNPEGTRRA